MKHVILVVFLLALLLSFTACVFLQKDASEIKIIPKSDTVENVSLNQNNGSSQQDDSNSQSNDLDDKRQSLEANTENYIKNTIENRATEVLTAIKDRDMEKLSQMIDPEKGVRFSPYGHVNTDTDLVFSAVQIKTILTDTKKYTWGSFDGSGEPIELTFEEYYKKFIYDEDFINAKEIGYNKIIGKGNTLINSSEVYPKAIIVEYHFPGFNPEYQGMDWKSLRLVFEKSNDTWFLVGIIHDQWTI